MGQLLHGSAKTTHAVRAELQRSQAPVAQLAKRFGINEKTVIKWRGRDSVEDMPMGPKERRSTVLSPMEEAAIVALRVQARLPLDDVFIALKDVIPHLTRSSLHRCLQRHGISRLPKADREKPKKFKKYEIGYFHIDIAELRYEGGKGFLYVAVDRTSKLVFARIYRRATKLAAAAFLRVLIKTVPYRIHTILTDNGVQFVQRDQGGALGWIGHIFGRVCEQNGIEHRLTKPYHPWTNGQAERMVRTIKEATVKSFHYTSINELRRHVRDWLVAYNFAKQLKALRFKTPYEAIEELWKSKPDIFNMKPHHHMLGLNT
ncbi:IS481 family transposase [Altererythrobacter sp. KTW20L]|uniref:IS481 family transposase n=1 Tax=Altererythrobacter sp. KTW20L TaxID=2942210 RepID=UPI0020C0648F|nr:IS481 family transposase [Altererythrobacter sp. KTW20L]MCL6252304.1 IS481 family transposase [Altererythrobacter sp. KTW20L]